LNLYAYVNNDPLNQADPTGLCAQAGCGNADPSTQLISTTTAGATMPAATNSTSTPSPVQLASLSQPSASTQMGSQPESALSANGGQNADVFNQPGQQSGQQLALEKNLWCAGPNSMCAIGRGKGLTSDTPGVLIDRDYPGEFQLCQTCFRLKFGKPLPEDYP
jgi:hypothetical protein